MTSFELLDQVLREWVAAHAPSSPRRLRPCGTPQPERVRSSAWSVAGKSTRIPARVHNVFWKGTEAGRIAYFAALSDKVERVVGDGDDLLHLMHVAFDASHSAEKFHTGKLTGETSEDKPPLVVDVCV